MCITRRKIYMFKKTKVKIECELDLILKEYETIEDKLKELGIVNFKIIEVKDGGECIVDLRAMEMLK